MPKAATALPLIWIRDRVRTGLTRTASARPAEPLPGRYSLAIRDRGAVANAASLVNSCCAVAALLPPAQALPRDAQPSRAQQPNEGPIPFACSNQNPQVRHCAILTAGGHQEAVPFFRAHAWVRPRAGRRRPPECHSWMRVSSTLGRVATCRVACAGWTGVGAADSGFPRIISTRAAARTHRFSAMIRTIARLNAAELNKPAKPRMTLA